MKRWFNGGNGGDGVRPRAADALNAMYRKAVEYTGSNVFEVVVNPDYYPLAKRVVKEAGLEHALKIRITRWSRKQPKCSYKTIKRDCAKKNR